MRKIQMAALLCALTTSPALAQAVAQPAPAVVAMPADAVQQAAPGSQIVIRGGAQIPLRFVSELTTEERAVRVNDRVRLEVAEDVVMQGVVVIPRGTPVTGELTRVRYKGMWGRSGAIEGRVVNMQLNGRTVRMSGTFSDRGVTGTAGVVASIALVPVVGFFVTGTSARIAAGAGTTGYMDEDVTFTVPEAAQPATVPAPVTPAG